MNEALMGEIDEAYRRLNDAAKRLAEADRELSEYVGRVRVENAEALLEAKTSAPRTCISKGCSTPTSIAPSRRQRIGPSWTTGTPAAKSRGSTLSYGSFQQPQGVLPEVGGAEVGRSPGCRCGPYDQRA